MPMRLLTTAHVFALALVAIGLSSPPILFAQGQRTAKEWRFDEAQPDWHLTSPFPSRNAVALERTMGAIRVTLSDGSRMAPASLWGGVYIDLPDWRREEWGDMEVRARTSTSVSRMQVGLDPGAAPATPGAPQATFQRSGGVTPVVRDGVVRTYRIHLDWGALKAGPWRRVGLQFQAPEPGSIDILSVRVVPATAESAQAQVIETMLEPPQLKSDLTLFRRALEESHAGMYRWTTKQDMDAEFARAEASLTRPMTVLQFRNVLLRVVAAIKCGHTLFSTFQGDEISSLLNSARRFPLALKFDSDRAFVVLNQGVDERARPGMEVLAINGEPLAAILRRILPYVSHDGDIRTNRSYVLSQGFHRLQGGSTGFSRAYHLYIGNPTGFKTTLRDPQTRKTVVVDLIGVTDAEAAVNVETNPVNRDVLIGIKSLQTVGESQSIRYLGGESTAVLRLPGFRDFGDFLAKAFAELKSNGTKNLIIDLRGNSGGRDASIPLLFSYLAAKEFRIYDRIHMTTYQPSFRQHADQDFTPATGYPEFSPEAGFLTADPNGGWLLTEKKSGNRLYQPAANRFEGRVFVLMDGGSFSATADFIATVVFHKRATLIGEETGGVAEGNNSGVAIGLTLPESQLHIGIPTYRYFNVVSSVTRARGTLPTYAVTQRIDDLAKDRDTALEFTRDLIRTGKGQ